MGFNSGFKGLNKERTLYAFFWVTPRRLNSDAGELPRRKHTTFKTRRKFEIKKGENNWEITYGRINDKRLL